jgi:hypothetical protein
MTQNSAAANGGRSINLHADTHEATRNAAHAYCIKINHIGADITDYTGSIFLSRLQSLAEGSWRISGNSTKCYAHGPQRTSKRICWFVIIMTFMKSNFVI